MVARGDLGVELELERVPFAQKLLIRTASQFCRTWALECCDSRACPGEQRMLAFSLLGCSFLALTASCAHIQRVEGHQCHADGGEHDRASAAACGMGRCLLKPRRLSRTYLRTDISFEVASMPPRGSQPETPCHCGLRQPVPTRAEACVTWDGPRHMQSRP